MPVTISRAEALAQVSRSASPGRCPMCEVAETARLLRAGRHACITLNRYPLRWGHMLVITKRHVERFREIADDEHAEAAAFCLRAARAMERTLSPPRVFVASLGSARENLPMTCPHLHWHVVPVAHGERPRDVLTWKHGVLQADEAEWQALEARLSSAIGDA
jgi:diadenosine tetraphosphate (Ap4A) HIT family hydrolase